MIPNTGKPVIDCRQPVSLAGHSWQRASQLSSAFSEKLLPWDKALQGDLIYARPEQRSDTGNRSVEGDVLCTSFQNDEYFQTYRLLPANVSMFLDQNDEQIPTSYRGNIVAFWGSIYRGRLVPMDYIQCLDCRGKTPTLLMVTTGRTFGKEFLVALAKVAKQ